MKTWIALASARSLAGRLEESAASAMTIIQIVIAAMRRQVVKLHEDKTGNHGNEGCSNFQVSATQYALCREGGVCSTYCQVKERKASGVCAGPTRWDCFCVDSNGNREAGKAGQGKCIPILRTRQHHTCVFFFCSGRNGRWQHRKGSIEGQSTYE